MSNHTENSRAATCEDLHRFVDGELNPEERTAFADHLTGCQACQRELERVLSLQMVAEVILDRGLGLVDATAPRSDGEAGTESSSTRPPRAGSPRRLGVGLALAAGVALLAGVTYLLGRSTAEPEPLFASLGPERRLEFRLAYQSADRYLPLRRGHYGAESGPISSLLATAPVKDLERLQRTDPHAFAAVLLAYGVPQLTSEAAQILGTLDKGPEVDNDRAVALLASGRGHEKEALRLLDGALVRHPDLTQAMWNRGLALRNLDQHALPLSAARAFEAVALREEEGWSDEARHRERTLKDGETARYQEWERKCAAGRTLVDTGALPTTSDVRSPILRLYFYDAVRSATSAGRVLGLLDLARQLDAVSGGDALERYIQRTAVRDFSKRRPLAEAYRGLVGTSPSLADPQVAALLNQMLATDEDDLVLGLLYLTDGAQRYVDEFTRRAVAMEDPWFTSLAEVNRANAEASAGALHAARARLERALPACEQARLTYRCLGIRHFLADIYLRLDLFDAARSTALEGWNLAVLAGEWGHEATFIEALAAAARMQDDFPLARAYLEESSERRRLSNDGAGIQFQQESLAQVELNAFQFDRARTAINEVLKLSGPLTPVGAMALSDIARLRPQTRDLDAFAAFESERSRYSPGKNALITHILGRFWLEKDLQKGRGLLRQAIREGRERLGAAETRDVDAVRSIAYSYGSLILEAGKSGDFSGALRLFVEELEGDGAALPTRCVVGLTEDSERAMWVVLGQGGSLRGHYVDTLVAPLPQDLEGFVDAEALASLEGCEQVSVLARGPLYGRAGILPSTMAWRFARRLSSSAASTPREGAHLVVDNVPYAPERKLPRLDEWNPPVQAMGIVSLSGPRATPSRVSAAMRDATEIDLVTHGVMGLASESTYLVLAPGDKEGDVLGIDRIPALRGQPFVILVACQAAKAGSAVHASMSLPAAFVSAGARGVVAATVPIPTGDGAQAFFEELRLRIRQGVSPAKALRDVRVEWSARKKDWARSVLLFE
ncbi:CHAT domain-containing protein [Myxococcus sp. K15C18031901]|uniref:zf-HC2 domain-containing protein n=1 Tax=Myxococcus dinghuensis TaxID=2906761 RepID=UPI0020A7C77D|nr:zf-HC2 domain-containing protein [Myxococcus dinghuensis]MCP3099897.1 CHAT domain-containing protein [Myxococcus dinghuensis]